MSNSFFCGADMRLGEEDRMLCCSAFSHMWGILNYWSGLIHGTPQLLLQRYTVEGLIQTALEGAATVMIGAPYTPSTCWPPPASPRSADRD